MEPSAPYFKQDRICTGLHIRVKHSVHHFPAGFTLFTNWDWVILRFRKQDPILYDTLLFHFPSLLAVSFCGDLPCNYKHSSAKKTFLSVPFFCPCFLCLLFLPRSIFVEESPDWPNWTIKDLTWKVDFYKITDILLPTDNLSEMGSKFLS